MGGGSAEKGIGDPDLVAPPGRVVKVMHRIDLFGIWYQVRVDNNHTCSCGVACPISIWIAEIARDVCGLWRDIGLEHAFLTQSDCLQDFAIPKDVGLGRSLFGDQAVDQAGGFSGFYVVDRLDTDAGLLFETIQDWLGKRLVDRCVDDDLFGFRIGRASKEEEEDLQSAQKDGQGGSQNPQA